jgi:23S rRNA pseudouridine2457 synthase
MRNRKPDKIHSYLNGRSPQGPTLPQLDRDTTTLLLNKPYGVLSQFTPEPNSRWRTLAELVNVPGVYAAGRLDADSEGLLVLTSSGALQARLTHPRWAHWRTYHVQVEGTVTDHQLQQLRQGLVIQKHRTLEARVKCLESVPWHVRVPPIRTRHSIPTTWLELCLREGRNRQVRRMTAAVGLPTLRLIRTAIDLGDGGSPLHLSGLLPGEWRPVNTEERCRLQVLVY